MSSLTSVYVAGIGMVCDSADWSVSRLNPSSRYYDGGRGGYAYPGPSGPQLLPTHHSMGSRFGSVKCGNCGSSQYMVPAGGIIYCQACQQAKRSAAPPSGGRAYYPLSMHGPQLGVSLKDGSVVESISAATTSSMKSDDRKRRLQANVRTLYHQTSSSLALSIVHDQNMSRGTSGLAGAGIYFAESPQATERKAVLHGAILAATVALGNVKTISKYGDASASLSSLIHEGYDSVCIPRDAGYEYVVYHHDQVSNIRICS